MEDVDVRRRTETNEIRQHTGHDIHVPDHDHMTVSDFICVFGKLRNSHPDTAIPLFFYDYSWISAKIETLGLAVLASAYLVWIQ